jgi:hypothetical protein
MSTLQLIQLKMNQNIIKMENYIQQTEGTSLIKRGSFIDLGILC